MNTKMNALNDYAQKLSTANYILGDGRELPDASKPSIIVMPHVLPLDRVVEIANDGVAIIHALPSELTPEQEAVIKGFIKQLNQFKTFIRRT